MSIDADDIVAWTKEQTQLLRAGCFKPMGDEAHRPAELEHSGTSEQREPAAWVGALWFHLLKWQYQPHRPVPAWILVAIYLAPCDLDEEWEHRR